MSHENSIKYMRCATSSQVRTMLHWHAIQRTHAYTHVRDTKRDYERSVVATR